MSASRAIDVRILDLASKQHGVVSARQLRRLGVSRPAVHRRIAAGSIRQVLPGVYAVGSEAVAMAEFDARRNAWQMAALLRSPGRSAISHGAAAAHHGAWDRWDGTLTISSASRVRDVAHPIRYARLDPGDDCVVAAGLCITSPERTVSDLGAELTAFQICAVIHEMRYRRLLDLAALERLLEQRRGATGIHRVRRALAMYRSGSAGTRSRTEDHLLEAIIAAGLPEPLVNNRNALGVADIEPDFAWPAARLIVEVDGASAHDQPGKRASDRRRDLTLRAAGWLVYRVDADRVWKDRDGVIGELRALLAGRRLHARTQRRTPVGRDDRSVRLDRRVGAGVGETM